MPVASSLSYVKSLLQGLTPPGDTGMRSAVSAIITPPDPDQNPDAVPRIYIWPTKGDERRIAQPRNTGKNTPAGWKEDKHRIDLFLVWNDDPNDPNADLNFPFFIDWVMDTLRTVPNPAQYADPATGRVSNMVNLGEIMNYDYAPIRTLEAMAMRRYDARIQCTLWELFQA